MSNITTRQAKKAVEIKCDNWLHTFAISDNMTVMQLDVAFSAGFLTLEERGLWDKPVEISIVDYKQHTDNTWRKILT